MTRSGTFFLNFKSYEKKEWLFHIFEPVDKILKCAVAIQMKATEHFSLMMYGLLCCIRWF